MTAALREGQSSITFWIEDSEKDYEQIKFDSTSKANKPELVFTIGDLETDTTAPILQSTTTSTDGSKIVLTYNETLSDTTASASDFTVKVENSAAAISSVATLGSTVELTLASAVTKGQSITLTYTEPSINNDSNTAQDGHGNDAASFITTTVRNQVADAGEGILQILGSTVNDKDWDEHVGGKHLRADLSQLDNRDTTKAIAYQWYANEVAISGAIHLVATYTTLSGQQRIKTSPTIDQLDWRIFSGGEGGSIEGDNPTPFMETYSFSNSSRTHNGGGWYDDGYRASATHSITSETASELGLKASEGSRILKVAATASSKRAELGNRNWNTRVQENQDVYVSEKIYFPKDEWDPVTQYSTLIFQHKQYPGADPNFELRFSNEGDYKLYVRSPYGHYGLEKVDGKYRHNQYPIATLSPDTWHDLKIHLTPSQNESDGQITVYLDGKDIFSETGTNLNDRDNTNDSFLKLGLYTNIEDDRHYFVDAVEMSTFLPSSISDWLAGAQDTSEQDPEPEPDDSDLSSSLAAFDANAIAALPPTKIAQISGLQIKDLAPDSFQGFRAEQLTKLSIDAMRSIHAEQAGFITPKAIAGLNADQISSIKPSVFLALSAKQIRRLRPDSMSGLDAQQVSQMKPIIFKSLSATQLSWLSISALDGLTPAHIKRINTKAIAGLSTKQLRVFDATQAAALPKRLAKAFGPRQLAGLGKDAITGLSRAQLKHFPSDGLTRFQRNQIKALSAEAIPGLKPKVLNNLRDRQAQAFSSEQLLALSRRQRKQATAFLDQLSTDQRTLLGFNDDNSFNRWMEPGASDGLFTHLNDTSSLL